MSTLSQEKVLRINCPGFGKSSILPLGEAKPLAMYDVIIVNPSSILHLFDDKSDVLRQIETLQADGMTSYRAEDDSLIESLTAELDLRAQELSQFLKKGGLFVYFLAPPFTIQSPSLSMDNFSWLNEWAPDKPSGQGQRNMSATIRGKAIETTSDGSQSIWLPYLKQTGLEWSTIIRLDNLTDGYVSLATAGPNKCIAGFKSSGPKAGQVVFLPAPYNKSYDEKLKQCLEQWFAVHNGEEQHASALDNLTKELSSLLGSDEPAKPEPAFAAPAKAAKAEAAGDSPKASPQASDAPKFFKEDQNNGVNAELSNELPAKDLIRKMGQELSKPAAPEWCSEFSFAELDALHQELTGINEEMRLAQLKVQDLTQRIEVMEDLKNTLLSAEGEHLVAGCTRVFEMLGWQVKPALGSEEEMWLTEDDKTQAIIRLIYTTTQPNRSELASLAESVITYWGAHEIEPKGILVASTWADRPPSERTEEDFGDFMNEFAKRKNLGLLTTSQLLSIYRDITVRGASPKDIRDLVLTTSGIVPGFTFEASKGKAAAGKS